MAPDGGTAYLLTRAVGRVRAMEMMLFGDKLPTAKALEWGLINRVVEELESAALDVTTALAAGPTRALGEIRKRCWRALEISFAKQLVNDRVLQRELGRTADHQEAITAFFDKRPARFTGN